MRKLLQTLHAVTNLMLARTLGDYRHTMGGPDQPDVAVYEWRSQLWWVPLGPVS
ncbi:hypothetical protein KNJ79_05260 [Sphingopyxis indica]|uniref:hypothetical protein n=1 Tax=Sphingopyxis indica TaxID=436663 RepID=UPI002938F0B4|nr:hypothetical protein [Sphingopyxis indica]WOF44341.1 hypothetical protein KNJ79_05260 [Sphingopyxis indica]